MNSERIFFIIPPYFNVDDFGAKNRSYVLPPFTIPYGVLSLAAYLRSKCSDSQVSILDLNVYLKDYIGTESVKDLDECFEALIRQNLEGFSPTIVGISALFNVSFIYIEKFASVVKKIRPECILVVGGGLPSAAYKNVLELCPSIDAVCKGEGEIPLAELICSSNKIDVLNDHPSWVTRIGLAKGKIPQHTFVQNLDEIPMFDYDLINLNNYNQRSIDKRYCNEYKREMSIHTSRGCPFSCVFCANPALHGKKVRSMSVKRVLDEVRRMKEKFGMTVLLIEDDHFFFSKARAKDILKQVSDLNIRIEFPNGVAVYAIDDEVAELLSRSGTSTVALAVESGSDYVLKNIINKPLSTKMVKKKVEMLRSHGVQSHAFIVIGLPGEFAEHRKETLDLLIDSGFDWVHVFCAVPIFGSRLFDICIENGFIKQASFVEHVTSKCVIEAPGVDPDDIEKTAYDLNLNVNFVNNFNIKNGNLETAVKYLENVASKYPNHAFSHYYLAKVFSMLGKEDFAKKHLIIYKSIIESDVWWRDHAIRYNIAI